MSERHYDESSRRLRESVSIDANKVYDACREKDCFEDLHVYLTQEGEEAIATAMNVKIKKAEIIWVFPEIESVPFNKGYYAVDISYYFKVTLELYSGLGQPYIVRGLATARKRVVLFGSEGNSKIFTSKFTPNGIVPRTWERNNLPKAIVEVVDPIALSARISEHRGHHHHHHHHEHHELYHHHGGDFSPIFNQSGEMALTNVPESVLSIFDDDLVFSHDNREKRVLITLGVFTIVKIARNVQIMIPNCEVDVPNKECRGDCDENPCSMFSRIHFPSDEFYPPAEREFPPLITAQRSPNDERIEAFMEIK